MTWARIHGLKMLAEGDQVVSWCNGHGRAFEPETVAAFVAAVKADPACVIDVGAYTGLFTLLAHRAGATEIVAVEPNQKSCTRIRENANLNGCNLTLIEAAASDAEGAGYVEVRDAARTGLSSLTKVTTDTTAQPAVMRTVDSIAQGQRVSVMKIDVEGHELRALRGAHHTLAHDHPTLLVEVNSGNGGDRTAEVAEYLGALGYDAGQVIDGRNMLYCHRGEA
jgi:FkbM family methyltransferase